MWRPFWRLEMMERIPEASPYPSARITGVVYLFYFLTAVFGEIFLKGLVVDGDAAATANNILAHQPLFRLGIATGLIATACYVAVTALFYGLFKPVNRSQYDRALYKKRNEIERLFRRLKGFRRIFSRFENLDVWSGSSATLPLRGRTANDQ